MDNAVVLQDITSTIENIKYTYLVKWMKTAQRDAVLEWRDRTIPPGVAVRFSPLGKLFYGFSNRKSKKAGSVDYVKTGSFRDQLAKRKPKTAVNGGIVSTKFSIGGGAMNLIGDLRGIKRQEYLRQTKQVAVRGYMRTTYNHSNHPSVNRSPVRGYSQMRTSTKSTYTPADRTYREEFALIPADLEFINFKAEQNFIEEYRAAAFTSKGQLRQSVRLKFRNGGEEAA